MNEDIITLIPRAVEAAISAGEAILEVYGQPVEVFIKDDKTPLTIADKKAHGIISESLKNTGLPILSEEGRSIAYDERKTWDQFWLVDPLDGTKEFIKRNGDFTVNIALIRKGYPVLGIIYVPVEDLLYVGGPEIGAYKWKSPPKKISDFNQIIEHGTRLPVAASADVYRVIASRSHMSEETEAYVNEVRAERGEVQLLSRGSSLKLCMVAEGSAEEYPRFAPTMEWDTGAGQAIVEGAGRVVLSWSDKQRMPYNKENLLNDWFIVKTS